MKSQNHSSIVSGCITGLIFLMISLSCYAQPTARWIMDKSSLVEPSSLNPKLHHARIKKLIQTSAELQWTYVRDNIREMEALHPDIDGLATSMNGSFGRDHVIVAGDKRFTKEDVQLDVVSEIEWGRYTENFVVLYFGGKEPFEFFNDERWDIINYNAIMVSRMLEAGRFRGVFLDSENYYVPSQAWWYNEEWFPGKTREEVIAQVRKRGFDFMKALESKVSNPMVLLDFLWFADHWNDYSIPVSRQYLWMAFKDGMIEASDFDNVFVEGNECAYWYQESVMATDMINHLRQEAFEKYGASDIQDRYRNMVQIGHGLFPYNNYVGHKLIYTANPEERVLWWRDNLYNTLLTSDQYVWIWSEGLDFWKEGWQKKEMPESLIQVMAEVKDMIRKQESPDYDLVKYGSNWVEDLVKPSEKFHISRGPVINITSPKKNDAIEGTFTIETETDDKVEYVEFYLNSMRVGIDRMEPYSLKIEGLKKGTYTLFVRAFDKKKDHLTSAPVIFYAE